MNEWEPQDTASTWIQDDLDLPTHIFLKSRLMQYPGVPIHSPSVYIWKVFHSLLDHRYVLFYNFPLIFNTHFLSFSYDKHIPLRSISMSGRR